MIWPFKRCDKGSRNENVGFPDAIAGNYEILLGCIDGTVWKVPAVKNGNIWIEARRGPLVIAEYLVPDTGGGWLKFTMPIDGRFSLEDLARETVTITARNSRGDTGSLIMDGATRLELIRRFMGVPVEAVFDLNLGAGGNARPYLGPGWSPAEAEFSWTLDKNSFVRFKSPTLAGTYLLRMKYGSYITDFIHAQRLEVYINDELVATFNEDARRTVFREIKVEDWILLEREWSDLRLFHPNAARPDEQSGVADSRNIAFSFFSLALVRVIETPD